MRVLPGDMPPEEIFSPGERKLPHFETHDYRWNTFSSQDFPSPTILLLIHPLDNRYGERRATYLQSLDNLGQLFPTAIVTYKGNYGANASMVSRLSLVAPVLFDQPDGNLSSFVESWAPTLPIALLIVEEGVVKAWGDPLALAIIEQDARLGITYPLDDLQPYLGAFLPDELPSPLPAGRLGNWLSWRKSLQENRQVAHLRQELVDLLIWTAPFSETLRGSLLSEWTTRLAFSSPPPEGLPAWLGNDYETVLQSLQAQPSSLATLSLLARDATRAVSALTPLSTEADWLPQLHLLVATASDPLTEDPHLTIPETTLSLFRAHKRSRSVLFSHLQTDLERVELWYGEDPLPPSFHFLLGTLQRTLSLFGGFGGSEDSRQAMADSAEAHLETLVGDPLWADVQESFWTPFLEVFDR